MSPLDAPSSNELVIDFHAPAAKVLIVDDSKTNLEVASWFLAPYQLQIITSTSGYDAIKRMQNEWFDLIFMDHLMPELDGIQTVRYIRTTLDTPKKKACIIALSANTIKGAREFFMENGMDDYLSKPFDPKKLNEMLKKYLPAEKQIHLDTPVLFATGKTQTSIEIEGIDVQDAIVNCGNDLNGFLSVLCVFYLDGIRTLPTLNQFFVNRQYEDLTILIHALKSACANVGAVELAKQASGLEDACEKKNYDYIQMHTPDFIVEFEKLMVRIAPFAKKKTDTSFAVQEEGSTSVLKDKMPSLQTALELADSGTIDEIMAVLTPYAWDTKVRRWLQNIQDAIDLFDYDLALQILACAPHEL